MNIANGPVRPTPGNLNPPLDYCVQLTLPNDREWIAAFYDALYQLTYWFAWQRDDAHTGKDIAAIWLSVLANMKPCKPLPLPDGCCDGGEPLYRQNPDNPCLLESSADGVHWCTLFDVSLCVNDQGQPGGGSPQPEPGGGEKCYHINQQAGYQILVPTVVNDGDMLTFSNFGGAANDGVPGRWDCPNGKYFFAGTCQDGTEGYDGGDPLPSAPHMSVIAQIDGIWYSCLSPVTVPGGVANAQVLLQLNDSAIGDNQGQYALDVCVTNNSFPDWSADIFFNLSLGDFYLRPDASWTPDTAGVWTAGAGWVQSGGTFVGTYKNGVELNRDFASPITITAGYMRYSLVKGTFTPGLNNLIAVQLAGVTQAITTVASETVADGSNNLLSLTPGVYSVDRIVLEARCCYNSSGLDGTCTVKQLHLEGKGPNPFA